MRGIKALTLAAALAALFCACGGVDAPTTSSDLPGLPEEPLITIEGTDLGQGEIVYLLLRAVDEYALYRNVDWDGFIEGMPAGRYFLERTLVLAVSAHVTDLKAAEMGYTLTYEEEAEIDWLIANEIDYSGGHEAFLEDIGEFGLTEELYRFYSYTVPWLQDKMIDGLFGPDGVFVPSEIDLLAYYRENYIPAAYIFLSGTDATGDPLTGDELTMQKSVVEALRRQAAGGGDFFGMMELYGQDYTMTRNPEGMPIPLGLIGGLFDMALKTLAVGDISEVVVTDEGFYIILRLPEDLDWFEYNKDDLLYFCGSDAFLRKLSEWGSETDVSVSDAFWDLDPLDLISVG